MGFKVVYKAICYDNLVVYLVFLKYIFKANSYILRILLGSLRSNNLSRSRYY